VSVQAAFTNRIRNIAGTEIPGIIYGTAWKKERTADLVETALLAGFKGIDTAGQPKHYDEALVGAGLQRAQQQGIAREQLYLQTKFTPLSSQDPERLPYDKHAAVDVQVAQSFASSQRNLHSDYVDCFTLHSPLASHELTMQAWQAMEDIHRTGGARLLGISNCYDFDVFQALYADADVKPAIVQNRFYQDTNYEVELRQWCAEQGVIFQSFWSLTANKHILHSTALEDMAVQYHRTPAQIFFRFLSQAGIVPLTGTCSLQHMREDLAIFEFELADADFNQVKTLLTQSAD
jgi:diketogulonate reductase-like aldo/keto reductase